MSPALLRRSTNAEPALFALCRSFANSHMRLEEGGWARETTIRELPTSIKLAGVNTRLEAGVYRELHWHNEAEWAYMLKGSARIAVLDVEGGSFMDDLEEGDLWYFPMGFPHSIQGTGKIGCEFLLIFDNGHFSEDSTFLLTDWLSRTPKEILSKNFQIDQNVFAILSQKENYIFCGTMPGSLHDDKKIIRQSKHRFTHRMLRQKPLEFPGGQVRVADTSNFPIATTVAAAHVIIKSHAVREIHWHPNGDEWSHFISGKFRVTIFASSATARTFDYQAGDVMMVPMNYPHYIENVDDGPMEMLEMFRAPRFEDFSLHQWMAQTPPIMVAEHLNLKGHNKEKFLKALNKDMVSVKPAFPRSKSVSDIEAKALELVKGMQINGS